MYNQSINLFKDDLIEGYIHTVIHVFPDKFSQKSFDERYGKL